MIIIKVTAAVLLSFVVLEVGFIYCYTVAGLIARKIWMPKDMLWVAKVLYYPAALCDAIWNQTRGRWIFREWSTHGIMFSNCVQWHIDNSKDWRKDTAVKWATVLNAVAPDHIKRLP